MVGLWFKKFRVDRTEFRGTMHEERLQLEMGEFRTELAMQILVKQSLLSGQDSTFDDDVDEPPVQDLALNVDQTMFMANLSSANPIYDEAGLTYDSDILSENYVVDSDAEYTSDSNIIPYEQYVKDNAEQVVQSNVSSMPNDALMMIINDMHDQAAQCISANEHNQVVNESLPIELARYKEQVEIYEKGQEDTLELAEITRKEMLKKMKSPLWVKNKFKIAPRLLKSELSCNFYPTETIVRRTDIFVFRSEANFRNDSNILRESKRLSLKMLQKIKKFLNKWKPRFSKMHDAYTVEQARKVELEAEISKLKHKIQKDDHIEMIKHFSNLEALDSQNIELTEHVTALQEQNERFRAENEKVKQHYKELYDSIKIRRAKTIKKTSSLLTKNEKLKAHLKGKVECITMNTIKPKVLALRVNHSTEASGPKPKSNIKNNRILPAKSDNKKKVEDHPRNNKYNLKQENRVDSSIGSKNEDDVDLLKGSYGSNLYTISVEDMMKFSPIFLLSKASKNKSWLWHRWLNYLNFDTINDLTRKDLVRGLPRLKFEKDHLCSACQLGKSKNVGISHQKSVPRTPQQNGIVERRNCTLVEAARTILIFSKALVFLWAEVVATACYTQNRSLIHTRHIKTPYELVHGKKPDLTFLRVFCAPCYPTNDNEDLRKLKAKADIGIFVGYAPNKKGYRIYNK
ncbi:retrovirus-related pol polyprotein from transposon TNT 1-94 [Tanacetum coccineum]